MSLLLIPPLAQYSSPIDPIFSNLRMSDEMSREATSLSHGSGERTSEINIKPTDNQMPVAELKGKLIDINRASVHQQSLFFRGRVLNNDPTLSEDHVIIDAKEGHTLNLVTRRDGQNAPGSISADGNLNTGGNDSSANGQRIRPGQEPHNVIFGANMTETGTGEEMTDQIVRGTYQANEVDTVWWRLTLCQLVLFLASVGLSLVSSGFAHGIVDHHKYRNERQLLLYLLLLIFSYALVLSMLCFSFFLTGTYEEEIVMWIMTAFASAFGCVYGLLSYL